MAIHKLSLFQCKNCKQIFNPPIYACKACSGTDFQRVEGKGSGIILTTTKIRVPPVGFEDQAPYDIVVVQTDDGIRVPGRICSGRAQIGKRVNFQMTEHGIHWFKVLGKA